MDEILKSEIFIVLYGEKEGVSFEEFGELFRMVHGYNLNLSNYGYSSLRELLNDMNDLVELKTINGQHMMRCKSPERHHVVVSYGNNSSEAKGKISDVSNIPLPPSGRSSGPVVSKTERGQPTPLQQNHVKQVNSTNSSTRKKSTETPKSKFCLPAKTTYHMKNPRPIKCGFSSTGKTATINKATKDPGVSASLKPPNSNPVHARPAGNVPIAAVAAKSNNVSEIRHKRNSKSTNPKSDRNLTFLQNIISATPRVIESMEFSSRIGPGLQPNVTYASICSSNVQKSQVYHNGQQFTPNNIRFNGGTRVNSTNATDSSPRAEPRVSVHSNIVIKENIQLLLNHHNNGLSVFQLQKLYLFKFQQPLKLRGSTTLKQLFLELKDVVKIEGVGVQMLVFPVPAESNPTAAANGELDAALQRVASLLTKKDMQQEIVLSPHSSDCFKIQNEKLQEAVKLGLHDEQTDPIKGCITKVVKIKRKPPTEQNMQTVENIPNAHVHYVESAREELSVPTADAKVSPNHINGKPQHKAPPSAQEHHQIYKSSNWEEISDFSKNAHYIESHREELSVLATDERVSPTRVNEKPQHKALPSAREHHQIYKSSNQEEMSHLGKNVVLEGASTKNGSSQNVPEDPSLHHLILHLSGFSLVMGQHMNRPQNKENEMNISDVACPLTEQKMALQSNNKLKGPEHSTQLLSNTSSSMILQDAQPHQESVLQEEDTENLLLQPQNSMDTMKTCGQTESPESQLAVDFQTANNCNISEPPPSHSIDSLQTETTHVQLEMPSPVHQTHENRIKVKQEETSSSNSEEEVPNSQIINNVNIFSNVSPNEKAPKVQPKNVIESTSQQEASVSLPTNDLDEDNAHDLYVDGTEQAAPMSSDVHKVENIHTSKREQDTSTLPTKQVDEFTTAESIVQTSLLSSRPREEIIDPPKNILQQLTTSAAQSEVQNNLESILEQQDMNTWQTSKEQVCCIL